jgi:hypothetical protein
MLFGFYVVRFLFGLRAGQAPNVSSCSGDVFSESASQIRDRAMLPRQFLPPVMSLDVEP